MEYALNRSLMDLIQLYVSKRQKRKAQPRHSRKLEKTLKIREMNWETLETEGHAFMNAIWVLERKKQQQENWYLDRANVMGQIPLKKQ